jgi:hypothetical protein
MMTRNSRYSHLSAAFIAAAFVVVATACNDSSTNTVPLVPTTISANSGSDTQVGTAGQPLAQAISVHVADQDGNAVSNAAVTWTVQSSGGSVSAPTSTTGSTGDATVAWTLGSTVGVDSLKASIASGASVTLTATANAAAVALVAEP